MLFSVILQMTGKSNTFVYKALWINPQRKAAVEILKDCSAFLMLLCNQQIR